MGRDPVNWFDYWFMLILFLDLGSSLLSAAATVPQNLTSGRRSKQLIPKSLILEATAREDGTNLYGGILQPGRYAAHPPRSDEEFPRRCCDDRFGLRLVLCGLQHGAFRNLALCHIAPDRNQQLAGERNNRDPSDPTTFFADAGVKPAAQSACRLMSLP